MHDLQRWDLSNLISWIKTARPAFTLGSYFTVPPKGPGSQFFRYAEYLFVSFNLFWRLKQPPEVFCKTGALKYFANFTGKHLRWSLFLVKLQAFQAILKNSCEQQLLWRTQLSKFYNYSFEGAKILFYYYLCWILQLVTSLKLDSAMDVFVS